MKFRNAPSDGMCRHRKANLFPGIRDYKMRFASQFNYYQDRTTKIMYVRFGCVYGILLTFTHIKETYNLSE